MTRIVLIATGLLLSATAPVAAHGLPSSADCARSVEASPSPEVRPGNTAANATGDYASPPRIDGASAGWQAAHRQRVRGDYTTGTTEEILRWGACKWGQDAEITRARAWTESSWRQPFQGDSIFSPASCALIDKAAPCYQSYGILQVKGTVHERTYPWSEHSTPFNVDYALAWQHACLVGDFAWLGDGYRTGDVWGCVGAWYSGEWYDDDARGYIASVRLHLHDRPWQRLSP